MMGKRFRKILHKPNYFEWMPNYTKEDIDFINIPIINSFLLITIILYVPFAWLFWLLFVWDSYYEEVKQ